MVSSRAVTCVMQWVQDCGQGSSRSGGGRERRAAELVPCAGDPRSCKRRPRATKVPTCCWTVALDPDAVAAIAQPRSFFPPGVETLTEAPRC